MGASACFKAGSYLVAVVADPFKIKTDYTCIGKCAPITANGGLLVWIQHKHSVANCILPFLPSFCCQQL